MIEKQSRAEVTLADSGGNRAAIDIIVLPDDVCPDSGQVTFVKRTTGGGDEIYIGIGNETPSSKNYMFILTDTLPAYTWDRGLYPGTIRALGSVATSVLSIGATYERGA